MKTYIHQACTCRLCLCQTHQLYQLSFQEKDKAKEYALCQQCYKELQHILADNVRRCCMCTSKQAVPTVFLCCDTCDDLLWKDAIDWHILMADLGQTL